MLSRMKANNFSYRFTSASLELSSSTAKTSLDSSLAHTLPSFVHAVSNIHPALHQDRMNAHRFIDFICLVLQGLGGGIASTANTDSSSNTGRNIMLAGLIIQLISLGLFAIACTDFFLRVRKAKDMWNPQYTNLVNSRLFKAFLFGKFNLFLLQLYTETNTSRSCNSHSYNLHPKRLPLRRIVRRVQ
jgi:hypothetical protein